ncbi:hypothetical protein GCM10011487_03410 [Steroidobacter agaridevorans]|uniref:DUF4124 domain-containing protein n=1 Tax=Steroidobacter agaridevorans TaxID=2695856 RepID=A0A829Y5Q5_9GAMM|nr:DUF4124 domain-containing protein [Steroidobacter agaridevorans]GFE78341.1 hypothetical protein GCM10011487_03410 [Steroidobacter agaridevorans]GFE89727.1 hypothetical protein GCM10011488_46810 [Steroidobacter agaridevorans]
MRTALYVLLALAAPAFAGQTVYKWVDEKGVTHFSDQPVAGAEKVELSGGANRPASPPPAYAPSAPQETPVKAGPAYSRFVIVNPQQDQAIINTGGTVTVQLAATPSIDARHTVALYLDGAPVAGFSGDSHEFSNMPRGTHTVKAVISAGGQTIQETPVVTFHVRQESGAQPPVGPAMRSKPPKRAAGNKLVTKQPSFAALNGSKAAIDPRTNLPVKTKPAPVVPPKAPAKPKPAPVGQNTGK